MLKKPTLLRCAVLAALLLPAAAHAEAENAKPLIGWRRDFQNVAEPGRPAEEGGKPLLLRFHARWCGPCRVMDARVWPDAEVARAVNERFTPVEIDIDSPDAAALARQYGIIGVPTIVLLNREGREVARANFMSPEQMMAFLKSGAAAR